MKSRKNRFKKRRSFEERAKIRDLIGFCLLEFSVKCPDNGDKVWCAETEAIVTAKLSEALGYIPQSALQHVTGEVLNRFGR